MKQACPLFVSAAQAADAAVRLSNPATCSRVTDPAET
jgi:hypothetical protein